MVNIDGTGPGFAGNVYATGGPYGFLLVEIDTLANLIAFIDSQIPPDDDNDGVANGADQCPATPAGENVDGNGCSSSQLDDDGDGVSNAGDSCPSTPIGETVNAMGCSATQLDDDSDGVNNALDQCPATPGGEAVNGQGCRSIRVVDTVCDSIAAFCVEGVHGLTGAFQVVVSPDGKFTYYPSALDDAVLTFSFDDLTGTYTFVQSIFDTDSGIDGLNSARGIAISPDGKHIYVAALLDDSVTTFSRNNTTGVLTFVGIHKDGVGGVDGLRGANSVTVSPDGSHVYVAGRSDDAIASFSRNPVSGVLTFLHSQFDSFGGVNGLDAVESVIVSPDGKHVYAAGESDNAVAVFSREINNLSPNFGKLTFIQALVDGVGGVDGLNKASTVKLDPTGSHLYVGSQRTNDGGGDWAAVFSRSDTTGELTFVESFREDDFDINASCGGIGPEDTGIAVSPDGTRVFLTNSWRSTVAEFGRNVVTGQLSLISFICNKEFGVLEGLVGVRAITTSPDGRFLHAASSSGASIMSLAPTERP